MKILLVEDLAVTSKPVKMLLTMEGHHVDVAEDPGEALDLIEENNYDFILMDLGLPEVRGIKNGVELTVVVREMGFDKGIVALTAEAGSHTWQDMKKAGLNACIEKPLMPIHYKYLNIDPKTTCFTEEGKKLVVLKTLKKGDR